MAEDISGQQFFILTHKLATLYSDPEIWLRIVVRSMQLRGLGIAYNAFCMPLKYLGAQWQCRIEGFFIWDLVHPACDVWQNYDGTLWKMLKWKFECCRQSWSQTWWHLLKGCQTNCLFATHKHCRVINTAIYTIGQIKQLKLKRPVCERTRASSSGLLDHVWFGSCGATSAQQAYDLSAVHAPFCCSHGSSQAVGCMLSVPCLGLPTI